MADIIKLNGYYINDASALADVSVGGDGQVKIKYRNSAAWKGTNAKVAKLDATNHVSKELISTLNRYTVSADDTILWTDGDANFDDIKNNDDFECILVMPSTWNDSNAMIYGLPVTLNGAPLSTRSLFPNIPYLAHVYQSEGRIDLIDIMDVTNPYNKLYIYGAGDEPNNFNIMFGDMAQEIYVSIDMVNWNTVQSNNTITISTLFPTYIKGTCTYETDFTAFPAIKIMASDNDYPWNLKGNLLCLFDNPMRYTRTDNTYTDDPTRVIPSEAFNTSFEGQAILDGPIIRPYAVQTNTFKQLFKNSTLRTVEIGELRDNSGEEASQIQMLYGCATTIFSNLICSESIDLSNIINDSDNQYSITYMPAPTRHFTNWGGTRVMEYDSYQIKLEGCIPIYMQTQPMTYTILVLGNTLDITYPNTWIWPQGTPDFTTAANGAEIAIQMFVYGGTPTIIANYQIF